MNARRLVSIAFFNLLFVLPTQLHATPIELSAVPEALPTAQRRPLVAKRADLLDKWAAFEKRKADFIRSTIGIKVPSPEADAATKLQRKLQIEGDGIVDEADNFNKTIKLASRVLDLDRQIAEAVKQLSGLQFDRAEHAFAWFKGQSEKAQRDMVSQLTSRFRDYAVNKSQSLLQENFLTAIETMKQTRKPNEVAKLADTLRQLGANDPIFQEWLRSFSAKAPRKVLVDGAKLAIEGIKDWEKLFKISAEMDKKTVQGHQEAALTVISMMGVDCPAMKELKLVASGAYDVGEAWATIFILDRGIKELTVATETQLANQKKIALHMKSLVDQRKEANENLARLPSL